MHYRVKIALERKYPVWFRWFWNNLYCMLQLANYSTFPWETWEFRFNLDTQLPPAFESIKLKSMRRIIGYKYFYICAFLCYHFLRPQTVTQYSLYSVYLHGLTLNSPKSYFSILCAKINPQQSYYERNIRIYKHLTLMKYLQRIFLVKIMTLTRERMPSLFSVSELTNQIVGHI